MVIAQQNDVLGGSNLSDKTIAIVGAGQAGLAVALRLRRQGFGGALHLVGCETFPPYQRPPLSKKYITNEVSEDQLLLKSEDVYADQSINLVTGCKVTEINVADQLVLLSSGREPIQYSYLVLATGGNAKPLPDTMGGPFDNVTTFRTLNDARIIRSRLTPGQKILVIGGGYIGLETAAIARKLGVEVTLVESDERILRRVACDATANYFRNLHESNGVKVLEGAGMIGVEAERARAKVAQLSDGTAIPFDFAVVGIGLVPATELAEAAGLECAAGIVVNGHEQTSHPNVFAAGDCAVFEFEGVLTRLESAQNAVEQAEHLADSLMGKTQTPYAPLPWFWSDQYDVKLQIAGLNRGYTQVLTTQGARVGSICNWYLRDGRMIAVDAINDTRAYMQAKRWLGQGEEISEQKILDAVADDYKKKKPV